ncbi:MAG: hypothetical protein V3T83_22915 [Acidobacteriota bacterium]
MKYDDPKSWGDQYCFVSLCSVSKLVINHTVGKRNAQAIVKSVITGRPVEDLISTSYVERQNRTVRMAIRRCSLRLGGLA